MTSSDLDLADFILSLPNKKDGAGVYELINKCQPLDTNSRYCNLLQCSHFAQTSVVARKVVAEKVIAKKAVAEKTVVEKVGAQKEEAKAADELVGFVSGYMLPDHPQTLFIWQVAVASNARGQGLATQMIEHLLSRSACQQVSCLETSITETNNASWGVFIRLAKRLNAPLVTSELFHSEQHFNGTHDTEILVHIGPFVNSPRLAGST